VRRTGPTVARFGVAPFRYAAGQNGHDHRPDPATTGHPLDSKPSDIGEIEGVVGRGDTSRLAVGCHTGLVEPAYILATVESSSLRTCGRRSVGSPQRP